MPKEPEMVTIQWPDGRRHCCPKGQDWLTASRAAGVHIPTGCLGGSCGACEIEVNGTVVRACIGNVPTAKSDLITVGFASDPHW